MHREWLKIGILLLVFLDLVIAFERPERAELGRYLFYDTRLSGNGTQSCASCHKQELAFTDGRAQARGSTGEVHPRSAMSLVNVASNPTFTWTNPRIKTLEGQALVPMFSRTPIELGAVPEALLASLRMQPVYRSLFPQAFPGLSDPFTVANVTSALAAFERTLVSAQSPYDQYHQGNQADAISESAKRGETIFFTDAPVGGGCFRCHSGPNFSGNEFHDTGLYDHYPVGEPRRFRTPTLRNITVTAPYMHDGSIATLEGVLDHYQSGGRRPAAVNKDAKMQALRLTAQNRADLLEFLGSLRDPRILNDQRLGNPWKN